MSALPTPDSGSKKVFEGLVDDEERHFNQYDIEVVNIEKFGERYLALQSIEEVNGRCRTSRSVIRNPFSEVPRTEVSKFQR
jgi:hypothetical protein